MRFEDIRPAGMTPQRALEIAQNVYGGPVVASPRRLREIRFDTLAAMHANGLSVAQMVHKSGYSEAEVRRFRIRVNAKANHPDDIDYSPEAIRRVTRAGYALGYTDSTIARQLLIDSRVIQRCRVEMGLDTRHGFGKNARKGKAA